MNNHAIAEQLAKQFTTRASNEADTRHQIINRLLHDVLSWPHGALDCEKHVHSGYIDYVLKDKSGRPTLLIEAKREGRYFELPTRISKACDQLHYVRLRTLATDPSIGAAVNQAAQYCPSIGCQYACVTNGHEYIIFRAFIQGKDFLDADAVVISGLGYFANRYTQAYNFLSYVAVTSERSLQRELGSRKGLSNDLFHAKNGITHYDSPFQKNDYAKYLEPIAKRYFGEIKHTDARMMNNCYVFARDTRDVQEGMQRRVSDSLTPYFKADGGEEVSEVRSGGRLLQRIARSLTDKAAGDVLILYGGKGAGKSTFLRKLMYHEPPQDIYLHAFPIIIDFLKAPQDPSGLTEYLWAQVTDALNLDGLLERPIIELQKLFEDRYTVAEKQDLAGYVSGSVEFVRVRNALLQQWKKDKLYVAARLKQHWEKQGKNTVLVFDNTDQLSPALQDHCFLSAHNIARELRCVVIISMREERYCRARTAGVLDAYQNSGFHLAAPELAGVFAKRIRLVIKDLESASQQQWADLPSMPADAPFGELKIFFQSCLRQFNEEHNALKTFLQECSRDNTRLALDFFAQFLSSGYTHVEEMVKNPSWTVIAHQVIRPMMIPQRFNYDEAKSLIPNLYQRRTALSGSHFTTIRILKILRKGGTSVPERSGYYRVDALLDDFESRFGMKSDCEAALDTMLRHGLIEANNRLDAYKIEKVGGGNEMIYADEVRLTAFGAYSLEHFAPSFTYLDLVSLDCGIADERVYEEFCASATEERELAFAGEKLSRLELRLKRVESFIKYLRYEEVREKADLLLQENEEIMPGIDAAFQLDKPRVLLSAKRNIGRS